MMQIHFYDQWDKQSQSMTKKKEKVADGMLDRIFSFQKKWGNHFIILFSVLAALFFSYLIFGQTDGQADGQAMGDPETITYVKPNEMLYTVHQGDTLWSIAEVYYPEKPREEVVPLIQEKNGLQGTTIHAGQTILLP